MKEKRQKNQMLLAFMSEEPGEARASDIEGSETFTVADGKEGPAEPEALMEEVCDEKNVAEALKRVVANKGGPGMDGMNVQQLPGYLARHWPAIREQLLQGTYKPQPVKRTEIAKPDGGVRKLGIPTVLDRFIQQAVLQVLQGRWDPTFSEHSYGFRPGRSAHQAVSTAQMSIKAGYGWVVDIDLEKFFDRVNHDRLMSRLATRIKDKRMLKLIRAFLNAGVLENGLIGATHEGTPQGGPLSPLLSNIVLDELDKELERRKAIFVRYADDCNIYVRSERAGKRVMESVKRFITRKLKLKVNESKSAVARPQDRKFLSFRFLKGPEAKRCIAREAIGRFKSRARELTGRMRGGSLKQVIGKLTVYLRGWRGYFGFCQTPWELRDLDAWIRRRLRRGIWRQWARPKKRYKELVKRGVHPKLAAGTVRTAHGPWRLSRSKAVSIALPAAYFESQGLILLEPKRNA